MRRADISEIIESSRVSKIVDTSEKFEFLGLSRCFSVEIEQTLKNRPKTGVFGWILDIFQNSSILAEF